MPYIIEHGRPVEKDDAEILGQDTPTILSELEVPDPSGTDLSWTTDAYAPIPGAEAAATDSPEGEMEEI